MFTRRAVTTLSRRAVVARPVALRSFASTVRKHDAVPSGEKSMKPFEEIRTEADLLPPGAQPGTMPTDLEQATGLERLEILGKMQGVDIFDMRPLDASRKGTLDDPIVVNSMGDEQYLGCTGYPVDSHVVNWLTCSRDRPVERCVECGSVYKMNYIGPTDSDHGHGHGHDIHDSSDGHHNYEGEPKTFADYVRPEYR